MFSYLKRGLNRVLCQHLTMTEWLPLVEKLQQGNKHQNWFRIIPSEIQRTVQGLTSFSDFLPQCCEWLLRLWGALGREGSLQRRPQSCVSSSHPALLQPSPAITATTFPSREGVPQYLNRAFSAPRIWTVDAGYLARLVRLPACEMRRAPT